jgi:hypothetical protein
VDELRSGRHRSEGANAPKCFSTSGGTVDSYHINAAHVNCLQLPRTFLILILNVDLKVKKIMKLRRY